ncbi:tyrosine--tRNA ligase [bacterium]|nr:tyrosine--tRNA ligase [bacterium]
MTLSVEEQFEIIKRGTAEIIPEDELIQKLEKSQQAGCPLLVKLGIDPTAPDIHLGFAVVLRKLRQFQDLGHEVALIVGDFTATIGDPSGKSKTRPMLSQEDVRENAKTYVEQLYKILDEDKTRVFYNGDWLSKMTFADVIQLASKYTVARILERDDFANRLAQNQPLYMHETLYPLCQGYDSVAIESDIEMGGTDQKFNNLVGRDLQREHGQEPQVVIAMPILVGTDGVEKMSKSLGNYIGITEPPNEMYGKVMSIPDEPMIDYFKLATNVPMSEIEEIEQGLRDETLHPKTVKQRLAREIVTIYHDSKAAQTAEEEFMRVFRDHELPEEIPDVNVPNSLFKEGKIWIVRLLTHVNFAKSNREARTLVEQGAVTLDGEQITEPIDLPLETGAILKVGRRFVRLVIP